ncbi:unnamed protein product [Trichogramma brassicae]|uniref:Ubiquitin conjugation factor E4 A n=1 Tax=Trichogramma brassicae TaxID=86971 RepID=A0A6H5IGB2_9HYME|nr:unnamed protein product [Trichogramma brassicae]
MCDKKNINPFAGLFSTPNELLTSPPENDLTIKKINENEVKKEDSTAICYEKKSTQNTTKAIETEKDELFDELIADVFGITMKQHNKGKKPTRQLIYINATSVDRAIFERLLLTEPKSMLISKENTKGQDLDSHVVQTEIIPYLFESYSRLQRYRISDGAHDTVESIRKIIMCNISTALQVPDIFSNQQKEEVISIAFSPILDKIQQEASVSNILIKQYWFSILQTFASVEPLANLIINHNKPKNTTGRAYSDTLFGSLLSLGCLPKTPTARYDFFDKPFQQNSAAEGNIWTALDSLSDSLHKVFHTLLKCSPRVRDLTLSWLGDCLQANSNRGKLWNSQNLMSDGDITTVSDNFMLNLGNVLLRLCQPFCSKPNDPKILKIDPSYCAVKIVILMNSPTRLYNPHLRARLAEGLEALLPNNDEVQNQTAPSLGTFHRQQLFIGHPYKQMIVPSLLHVFVSIEMTGQNVQFEQKFNYRRPMYIVMSYLWKLPEHRVSFRELALEAENNMESVQPPLFLRFINLLVNDAVFLLDDALSNITQLRQMMHARDSGEWEKLSQQEREQQTYYLEHIGMIARFDNILGRETIQTLKMLTSEIKTIFCHPTMVDRIAAMLNYLLLQLVGPNKKNLKVSASFRRKTCCEFNQINKNIIFSINVKVKSQKEYEFDPANLVLNICEIFINLSESDNFTLAVSQDGRSYSPELFNYASDVLVRIGGCGILGNLQQFAKNVELAAAQKKQEEEILENIPDEFLDPIMSTLMSDPVILPSSKTVVDRQTIARHLLSDQTDPFNRSPLTMDMVKSDVDLKNKIQEWIEQKKKEKHVVTED